VSWTTDAQNLSGECRTLPWQAQNHETSSRRLQGLSFELNAKESEGYWLPSAYPVVSAKPDILGVVEHSATTSGGDLKRPYKYELPT
jgi:hypothetical protein